MRLTRPFPGHRCDPRGTGTEPFRPAHHRPDRLEAEGYATITPDLYHRITDRCCPVAPEVSNIWLFRIYSRIISKTYSAIVIVRAFLCSEHHARVYTEGEASREGEYLELQRGAQAERAGLWECSSDVPVPVPPSSSTGLRYEPSSLDRDCGDFLTWREAQDFYLAAGAPGWESCLRPDGPA